MTEKSLAEAIHERYSYEEPLSNVVFVPKSAPGMKESGEFIVPSHVALDSCSVARAGDEKALLEMCQEVRELDLSRNLIDDWSEVAKILEHLHKISFLNLSGNPLETCDLSCFGQNRFPQVRKLILNSMKVRWDSMCTLLKSMPSIDELHLSLNNFCTVDDVICDVEFPGILQLHFNGNQISDWCDINKLGKAFPNLQSLVMIDNPICHLSDGDGEAGKYFEHLENIAISNTQISDWDELTKLRSFPRLASIRIQGIPLLEGVEEKLRRQLCIALLPNVNRLNGSRVQGTEREDAERAFIRHYMNQQQKPLRYTELELQYGKLDELADVDMTPDKTATVIVEHEGKTRPHKFASTWTLRKTKAKIGKILDLRPASFRILYNDRGGYTGCEELRSLDRTLRCYHIKDGDEFRIEMKK